MAKIANVPLNFICINDFCPDSAEKQIEFRNKLTTIAGFFNFEFNSTNFPPIKQTIITIAKSQRDHIFNHIKDKYPELSINVSDQIPYPDANIQVRNASEKYNIIPNQTARIDFTNVFNCFPNIIHNFTSRIDDYVITPILSTKQIQKNEIREVSTLKGKKGHKFVLITFHSYISFSNFINLNAIQLNIDDRSFSLSISSAYDQIKNKSEIEITSITNPNTNTNTNTNTSTPENDSKIETALSEIEKIQKDIQLINDKFISLFNQLTEHNKQIMQIQSDINNLKTSSHNSTNQILSINNNLAIISKNNNEQIHLIQNDIKNLKDSLNECKKSLPPQNIMYCDLCNTSGETSIAKWYCQQCNKFFCDKCKKTHEKLISNHHVTEI